MTQEERRRTPDGRIAISWTKPFTNAQGDNYVLPWSEVRIFDYDTGEQIIDIVAGSLPVVWPEGVALDAVFADGSTQRLWVLEMRSHDMWERESLDTPADAQ